MTPPHTLNKSNTECIIHPTNAIYIGSHSLLGQLETLQTKYE